MREIKFRAWDTVRQVMIQEAIVTPFYISDFDRIRLNPSDAVPMQYTGLKDKNGQEIFEGDIVRQVYHAQTGHVFDGTDMTFSGHHIGEVVMTASKGVCMRNPFCYSEETDETIKSNQYKIVAGYRCEVIGNIHDNPELLQAGLEDGQ